MEENMRLEKNIPPVTVDGTFLSFKDWILRIGNGVQQTYTLGDGDDSTWINIPKEVCFLVSVKDYMPHTASLVMQAPVSSTLN